MCRLPISATSLGTYFKFPTNGQHANLILQDRGLQIRNDDVWYPTELGADYAMISIGLNPLYESYMLLRWLPSLITTCTQLKDRF